MRTLTVVLVALVALGAQAQLPASSISCQLVTLDDPPKWITGLAATTTEEVLVVDALRNDVLVYDLHGHIKRKLGQELAPETGGPIAVHASGSGYLVSMVRPEIAPLDRNLGVGQARPLSDRAGGVRGLGSLYDWTASSKFLVGFGALLSSSQPGYELGYFRAPVNDLAAAEMVAPALDDGKFYLLGNRYFTSVGETIYYLSFDKKVDIYRLGAADSRPEYLATLPAPFSTVPSFSITPTGPSDVVKFFGEVERITMPVDLLSDNTRLIVFGRLYDQQKAKVRWGVITLDTSKPEAKLSRFRAIEIDSPHASAIVVGTKLVVFLRGAVGSLYSQKSEQICIVPLTAL